MGIALLYLGAGMALLFLGGDALVRGAVALARRIGISPIVIGLTLVGFGTSTPELLTSVRAALADAPALAVGNVVGSNIANILLILGLAATIRPMTTHPAALRRDGTMLVVSTGLIAALAYLGTIGRGAGAALVLLLLLYTGATIIAEKRRGGASAAMHAAEAELPAPVPGAACKPAAIALGGLGGLLLGAHWLVEGAIGLARLAGLSEAVIGLTIVAVGTSLPELVTSIVAAIRRQGDVALGNIIGSNIFNSLGILGAAGLVAPLSVAPEFGRFDVPAMILATVLLIAFAVTGSRIGRGEGVVLLFGYLAYLGLLAQRLPA